MNISISCLLFGEIRSLLSSQDHLSIQLLVPSPREGTETTTVAPAELWMAIQGALDAEALRCKLDEKSRAVLREVCQVSMLAVDDEFVDVAQVEPLLVHLRRPPSVAVIPPVSGG
jgi:molybdopterin converting factor small subunit